MNIIMEHVNPPPNLRNQSVVTHLVLFNILTRAGHDKGRIENGHTGVMDEWNDEKQLPLLRKPINPTFHFNV